MNAHLESDAYSYSGRYFQQKSLGRSALGRAGLGCGRLPRFNDPGRESRDAPHPPQEDKPPFGSCIFQHLPELCKFSIKNVVAVLHETILVKAFPAASTHLGLDEIGLRDPKLGA